MSKSDWTSGTYLIPDFAQGYFGTSAATGHNHQGLDNTDSAPQVALSNCVSDYTSGNMVMRVVPPYATTTTDFTCTFTKIGNVCTVNMPNGILVHSNDNNKFRVEPGYGDWPAAIVPTNPKFATLFVVKESDAADLFRTGAIGVTQGDTTASWTGYIDSTSSLVNNDWGFNATGGKGFMNGSFTYIVD